MLAAVSRQGKCLPHDNREKSRGKRRPKEPP